MIWIFQRNQYLKVLLKLIKVRIKMIVSNLLRNYPKLLLRKVINHLKTIYLKKNKKRKKLQLNIIIQESRNITIEMSGFVLPKSFTIKNKNL
jgi:hypothetical protein